MGCGGPTSDLSGSEVKVITRHARPDVGQQVIGSHPADVIGPSIKMQNFADCKDESDECQDQQNVQC